MGKDMLRKLDIYFISKFEQRCNIITRTKNKIYQGFILNNAIENYHKLLEVNGKILKCFDFEIIVDNIYIDCYTYYPDTVTQFRINIVKYNTFNCEVNHE
jgi:hypothetical protein